MNEQSWQEVSDDTSTENCPTPTTTHDEPSSYSEIESLIQLEFQPGGTGPYLVRARGSRLFLSLCHGELKFCPEPMAGSYWERVPKDGWFGLRNTVSGRYISHDDNSQIYVKHLHLTPHEYFTDCRDPNGGYILKQLKSSTNELMEVSISKNKKSLEHHKRGGTAWDFIETKYRGQFSWLRYPGIQAKESFGLRANVSLTLPNDFLREQSK